jgi:hypothetical protein
MAWSCEYLQDQLPASDLGRVDAEHLWRAVQFHGVARPARDLDLLVELSAE